MTWDIENVTDEKVWTRDYLREIVAARPKRPPRFQMFGNTRVSWFETEPGIAFIRTVGGEFADRAFAETLLRERLNLCNIKQAQYTVHRMQKVADWDEIMAKSTRLIQDGQVTLLRNGAQNIVAHVVGDNGDYQTEISREDPSSMAISQWQCDCPWDQFAWQRTRQWKKYEGRPCAHVLATLWSSQSTPLDEEFEPGAGQGTLFDPGTGQAPAGPGPKPQAQPQPQGPPPGQLSIPGVVPPQAPPGAEVIPQMPGSEPPPVSIPGGRPPSPADPIQHPGGTFSKVAAKYPYDAPAFQLHDGRVLVGEEGEYHSETMSRLDIDHGDIAQVGDTQGNSIEWHGDWDTYEEQAGAAAWDFTAAADDKFENSDMVRLNVEEYGVAQGKSVEHGAGENRPIPKNSIGEVLGQDPTTGWVDCNFPLHDSGPMEPFSVRAWIEPEKLTPMPGTKKPGPFIKRR